MSRIEDLLMEAWEMGIKDQVIERVIQKQQELTLKGKWMPREQRGKKFYLDAYCFLFSLIV